MRPADLTIAAPSGSTRVWFGDDSLAALAELAAEGDGRWALAVDARVHELHGDRLRACLGAGGGRPLLLPPGERAKSLALARRLIDELLERELSRDSRLIVCGGGAASDLAGLAAALVRRGLPWIVVPTTLVGQIDAAYGGKVAVNSRRGKNLIGTFHQPAAVLAAPLFLASLPRRELMQGCGELVKTAVLAGEELLAAVEAAAGELARGAPAALAPLIRPCVELKARLVEADERDRGARALLNLGHTTAHALEAWRGFGSLGHGRAVAIGLLVAARLAERPALEARLRRLLATLGCLPRRLPMPELPALAGFLRQDKNGTAGGLRVVLPLAPGDCRLVGPVPAADVAGAIAAVAAGLDR